MFSILKPIAIILLAVCIQNATGENEQRKLRDNRENEVINKNPLENIRQNELDSGNALKLVEATASSIHERNVAANAIDGKSGTRWGSSFRSKLQWLRVKLDRIYEIRQVVIKWNPTQYATNYEIQVSDNAKTWKTVFEERNGNAGKDRISLRRGTSGRFVRVLCKKRRRHKLGYSLYDISIIGGSGNPTPPSPTPTPPSPTPTPPNPAPNPSPSPPTSSKPRLIDAKASSNNGKYVAKNAIDGKPRTRWQSKRLSSPQWIWVELDRIYKIRQVVIQWSRGYATQFKIQVWDGKRWETVREVRTGNGGTDKINLPSGTSGRYVRVYGEKKRRRAYSLSSITIISDGGGAPNPAPNPRPNPTPNPTPRRPNPTPPPTPRRPNPTPPPRGGRYYPGNFSENIRLSE